MRLYRARSGAWWAWFGGSYGAAEEGSLEQLVVVPEDAVLQFYLFIGGASGNGVDELRVRVDGVELFSVGEGNLAYDAGYERVQVNLGGFADGGAHLVRFEVTTTGVPANSNFFVDDVAIETCPDSIFANGFESGDCAAWSRVVGAGAKDARGKSRDPALVLPVPWVATPAADALRRGPRPHAPGVVPAWGVRSR